MSKDISVFRDRIVSALFDWRKGYDKATEEHILQASNQFGHFMILWRDGLEEYTVVFNNDITGGDTLDSLEEAKEFALATVRGVLVRDLMMLSILGVHEGEEAAKGKWNTKQLKSFVADQHLNAYNPFKEEQLEDFVSYIEDGESYNGHCDCESCQDLFSSGEEESAVEEDTAPRVLH
ncbi:hypothetical protein KYLE_85 [Pantoea phage Kyle]|uniref:Uncharacterized protein n=1 Tax=Pantoea phage Kyle TaxID=2589665 RepID=A0A514A8R4_9CAUD|nr:hypothetical protein HWC52_gp085 [Pantoea phage Kyle]QDH49660.1 hypothetical protein KYLE_85 [Pantoea phage Kyle]